MNRNRIFWGLLFILGAIFLICSKAGLFGAITINTWKILWAIVLIFTLLKSFTRKNFFGIFFSIAFLLIVFAEPLGIVSFVPWTVLGAALLLSIGCNIIFPNHEKKHISWDGATTSYKHFSSTENVDGAEIFQEINFSSCVKYINSNDFKSAHFECNFGSMKIYFSDTIMADATATLYIENNFAGIELFIPKEWLVIDHISNSFAGVDTKGPAAPDGQHTLYIYGENNFGGITIWYV